MSAVEHAPDEGEVLVLAMARPSMVGAFTLSSILISIFGPLITALVIRSLWPVGAIPLLFGISYYICSKDVYLFGVLQSAFRLRASRNRKLWGYRSYAPR
ncbi:type VI secretion protein [Pseudomonas fragi]|uniref:Type VI secretion protein n=2 Tax=Pseudomonas fragi TaxID=296 RepID=A0A266LQG3_PSEFR|nr:type VI secretion protein [Pseudomonas fragi]MBK3445723.1 VirB3 family type IV secretion system protein [Pseudomonas lactis]MBM1184764.1 VirB3 family type IV secretion system protein [Pseudomonas lundensis]MQT53774.1 type VI secretion protein [Pseudomonas sp. FSL R10-2398]OZY39672.1 type VI secretion protein [Pseudomonas fragi]